VAEAAAVAEAMAEGLAEVLVEVVRASDSHSSSRQQPRRPGHPGGLATCPRSQHPKQPPPVDQKRPRIDCWPSLSGMLLEEVEVPSSCEAMNGLSPRAYR